MRTGIPFGAGKHASVGGWALALGLVFVSSQGYSNQAAAGVIFNESFTNNVTAETWVRGLFEYSGNPFDPDDVNIAPFAGHSYAGHFEDDHGWLFNIDLSNSQDVLLDFNWATDNAESGDRVRAGWTLGSTVIANGDTMDQEVTGATYDFYSKIGNNGAAQAWFLNNWTEIPLQDDGRSNNQWMNVNYIDLPSLAPSVWVAFWLDDGNSDNGYIDNIRITNSPVQQVPEPSTLILFGVGLLALAGMRRKQQKGFLIRICG